MSSISSLNSSKVLTTLQGQSAQTTQTLTPSQTVMQDIQNMQTQMMQAFNGSSDTTDSSTQDDTFSALSAQMSAQVNQLMALAQTKIANKSTLTSNMQSISDAIGAKDMTTAQTALNTLTSNIDQSKLTAQGSADLTALTKAISSGDNQSATNAFEQIQIDSQTFEAAIKTKTTSTSSQASQSLPATTLSSYA